MKDALTSNKKAENATLLLTYLSLPENLKKILGTGEEENQKVTLEVYGKCREIIKQDVVDKVAKKFDSDQEEEKKESS